MMSASEYIEDCKKRAIELANQDMPDKAIISMLADLKKHPETMNHIGIELALFLTLEGGLKTKESVIEFISGFR